MSQECLFNTVKKKKNPNRVEWTHDSHILSVTTPTKRWGLFCHLLDSGLGLRLSKGKRAEMTLCQSWAKSLRGLATSASFFLESNCHAVSRSKQPHEMRKAHMEKKKYPADSTYLPGMKMSYLENKSYSPNQVVSADSTQTVRYGELSLSNPTKSQNREQKHHCCFKPLILEVICYAAIDN